MNTFIFIGSDLRPTMFTPWLGAPVKTGLDTGWVFWLAEHDDKTFADALAAAHESNLRPLPLTNDEVCEKLCFLDFNDFMKASMKFKRTTEVKGGQSKRSAAGSRSTPSPEPDPEN